MQQCKLSRHMEEDRSVGQAFVETQRPLHICHVQSKTNQGNGHNHFSSVSTLRSSSASAGRVDWKQELPNSGSNGDTTSTSVEDQMPDPAGNALEAIWNDEWEKHVVDAALEKVKQQSSGKHYQIFFLQAIKQIPPAKVAETLGVKVDQVYLIKHRLTKVFEEALKELETKLG